MPNSANELVSVYVLQSIYDIPTWLDQIIDIMTNSAMITRSIVRYLNYKFLIKKTEKVIPKYNIDFKKKDHDQFLLYIKDRTDDSGKVYNEPHSHNYYCLIFLYEGELRHYADLENRVIFAPALLTLDIDQVHIHTDLADCKVFSMAFSADFLHRQHKKSQDHVEVLNRSNSLKGLTFYGDVHSAMGFGVQGDQIIVWKVVDKKLFTLIEEKITRNEPIQLSLNVNADQRLQFKYKQGDMNWKEIALDINLKGMSLEQWDRSPRPGLHYKGDTKEDAQFSNFSLTYGRK